jgi:hypothetical protein
MKIWIILWHDKSSPESNRVHVDSVYMNEAQARTAYAKMIRKLAAGDSFMKDSNVAVEKITREEIKKRVMFASTRTDDAFMMIFNYFGYGPEFCEHKTEPLDVEEALKEVT